MGVPHEIWLNGPICAGKDYVAAALAKSHGYWYLGVGQLIAGELEQQYGLAEGYIYSAPEIKDRYRTALQNWGNKRRAENPDYWLKAWTVARDKVPNCPAVQPSCRFIREAELAAIRNAIIVRIVTPAEVRERRIAKCYPGHTAANDTNDAESEVLRVPYHVELSGTLPAIDIPGTLFAVIDAWRASNRPLITPNWSTI